MPNTEFTSTDRRLLYRVRFSPGGETYFVEAGGAVDAQQKVIGLAHAVDGVHGTGIDTELATKEEHQAFYGGQIEATAGEEE